MALQTTTSVGLSDEMKVFYDRVLLERTVPRLIHGKFGQPKRIPKHGGRVIEWRRWSALARTDTPLVEGSLFTDLKDLTVTTLTGTVEQYGDAVGFSDIVQTTTIDPILVQATKLLAEQAGESIDVLQREVLNAGTTIMYANNRASRQTIVQATDNFRAMDAAGSTTAGGSLHDLRKIGLQMELNRARKIGGVYPVITHPRVMLDIQSTAEWREAQNYARTGRIFDGSVGELYGLRFWTTDIAKIFEDAGAANTDVYTMLVFGEDAFGKVSLDGHSLETIFKPLGSAGTLDPMNQQSTMAWKALFGTKILQQAFMLRYECSTSTGS